MSAFDVSAKGKRKGESVGDPDAFVASSGDLVFEDPYLGEMLKKVSYDQIYDEHVYIFSASSVSSLCFVKLSVLPRNRLLRSAQ